MRVILLALFFLVLVRLPCTAQSLEETLSEVGSVYAAAYIRPLIDGLGANLNTGLFQAAHVNRGRSGLTFYIGVRAMAMQLQESDRTFDLSYQRMTTLDVDIGPGTVPMRVPATYTVRNAPTIFGSDEPTDATVSAVQDTLVNFLGILLPVSVDTTFSSQTVGGIAEALNLVPFAVLQGGIGSYLGTSLMVRWLPAIEVEDLGSIGFFGFGVRHDLNQYLPLIPFDLAVQAAWQRVTVSGTGEHDLVSTTAFAANVEAAKRVGPVTLFGGLQTEESRVRIRYEQLADPMNSSRGVSDDAAQFPIRVDMAGANRMRFTVGADLALGPVHAYGDVNVGSRTAFSVGLGVVY